MRAGSSGSCRYQSLCRTAVSHPSSDGGLSASPRCCTVCTVSLSFPIQRCHLWPLTASLPGSPPGVPMSRLSSRRPPWSREGSIEWPCKGTGLCGWRGRSETQSVTVDKSPPPADSALSVRSRHRLGGWSTRRRLCQELAHVGAPWEPPNHSSSRPQDGATPTRGGQTGSGLAALWPQMPLQEEGCGSAQRWLCPGQQGPGCLASPVRCPQCPRHPGLLPVFPSGAWAPSPPRSALAARGRNV